MLKFQISSWAFSALRAGGLSGAPRLLWQQRQAGLLRYNCADSLDRTNAASYFIAVQVRCRNTHHKQPKGLFGSFCDSARNFLPKCNVELYEHAARSHELALQPPLLSFSVTFRKPPSHVWTETHMTCCPWRMIKSGM